MSVVDPRGSDFKSFGQTRENFARFACRAPQFADVVAHRDRAAQGQLLGEPAVAGWSGALQMRGHGDGGHG